ncbi:MAG: exodeoxyribonuclease VII large subunit [Bacteroidota bacterium]
MRTYKLFELNEHIRRVLALNFSEPLWVECELAQVNQSRGHYYLSLIEKQEGEDQIIAQVDGVIWQRTYKSLYRKIGVKLRSLLREGLEVKLKVRINFNERYGLKVQVEDIDLHYTLGQLELQRQQTLKALKKEGWIGKNARLALPNVIQRIAVISSERAAGYLDYSQQLETNGYGYRYVNHFFGAAMQGLKVEEEIIQQLDAIASQQEHFDVVVIIRGGGARLDLRAFDSYALAVAVAKCPLPVLIGIGHEVDEVVLDRVAHTALKTPTAVAEFLIQHNLQFEAYIQQLGLTIQQSTQQLLFHRAQQIEQLQQNIQFSAEKLLLNEHYQLNHLQQQLPTLSQHLLRQATQELAAKEQALALLDPAAVLQRGYSMTSMDGKLLTTIESVQEGSILRTHLSDGQIESTATSLKSMNNED